MSFNIHVGNEVKSSATTICNWSCNGYTHCQSMQRDEQQNFCEEFVVSKFLRILRFKTRFISL